MANRWEQEWQNGGVERVEEGGQAEHSVGCGRQGHLRGQACHVQEAAQHKVGAHCSQGGCEANCP